MNSTYVHFVDIQECEVRDTNGQVIGTFVSESKAIDFIEGRKASVIKSAKKYKDHPETTREELEEIGSWEVYPI